MVHLTSWFGRVRAQARRRLAAAGRAADATSANSDNSTSPAVADDNVDPLITEPLVAKVEEAVPNGIRIAAAWAWRGLLLAAAVVVLALLIGKLSVVVIPVVVSLLLAALLQPAAAWLRRRGVPRTLAAAIIMVGGLSAVAGTLTIVIQAFISGFSDLSEQVQAGIGQVQDWLVTGPLQLSQSQLDSAISSAQKALTENQETLTAGALSTATTVVHFITGFFVVVFTTFFFLQDGRGIWTFLTKLLPAGAREAVYQAGNQSWRTLISYVRATVLVAFVDAVGIGLGAFFLGLPLALPIAALVFLASFIPVIGATLSGIVAILVALVVKGPIAAVVMLIVVIGVQQLEGHILQPLLLGRAVKLHPLAVIVAIATGSVIAGIVGALVAVPLLAVSNTAVRYLASHHQKGEKSPPPSDEPPESSPTARKDAQPSDEGKFGDPRFSASH